MIKKFGVWILFVITGLLPIILVSFHVIVTGVNIQDTDFFKTPGFALIIVVSHGLSFTLLFYFLKKQNLKMKDIGWKFSENFLVLRELTIGIILSLVIYIFKEIALDSLTAILHGRSPTFHSFFNFGFKTDEFVLMAVAFLFPFVEESIFRGYPYQQWKSKWSLWKIILISSVIFGLMHSVGGDRDITSAINTAIIGVLYFLIFYWRKNLICSTATHSFYNLWIMLT